MFVFDYYYCCDGVTLTLTHSVTLQISYGGSSGPTMYRCTHFRVNVLDWRRHILLIHNIHLLGYDWRSADFATATACAAAATVMYVVSPNEQTFSCKYLNNNTPRFTLFNCHIVYYIVPALGEYRVPGTLTFIVCMNNAILTALRLFRCRPFNAVANGFRSTRDKF